MSSLYLSDPCILRDKLVKVENLSDVNTLITCAEEFKYFELQYGRILDIELKIPPRPPCYCFVEVILFSIDSL